MKWLILSDNKDVIESSQRFIIENNKKDKTICAALELKSLSANKKNFRELCACIIYADDEANIPAALGAGLSSVFGFLAAEKVNVITNIKLLYDYRHLFKSCFLCGHKSGMSINNNKSLSNDNRSGLIKSICPHIICNFSNRVILLLKHVLEVSVKTKL